MRNSKKPVEQKKKLLKSFDYDTALSFSGKDRKLASSIAREAKRLGIKVFYDRDQKAFMWGKSEKVYHDVYARQSRTVVPIVSANYLDCEIARFEYDIAKQEAKNRDQEYILPVQCDSSLLPGLVSTTGYLSAEEHDAKQIAILLKQKVTQLLELDGTASDESLQLQHADERLALGLLVTVAFPRQQQYYEQLFPDLSWLELQNVLESKGLITVRDGIPDAGDAARKAIPESSDEYKTLEKLWIESLEPISHYMDIAPALALHYLGTDRIEDAACLLAEVASGVDLGWWNSIYLSSLETLASKKLSSFQVETKLAVLNALGICLSHDNQYDEALKRYKSLERVARNSDCDYWLGQAYINSGVALFHKGDRDGAVRRYHTAKEHGTDTRDWKLVGRALGNLAESTRESDVAAAREFLVESVKAKRRAKDEAGLVASFMQQGNLEADEGNPAGALRYYSKCEKACGKTGEAYLRSLALHNLGKASAELGRQKTAIRYFSRALEIAEESGFDYPLTLSRVGLGVCLFEKGNLAEARDVFENLLHDAERLGDLENQICSLHAIAVATSILDGPKAATGAFGKAVRFSKKHNLGDWHARVIADRSRGLENGELTAANPSRISRTARQCEKAGNLELAFWLWHYLAGTLQAAHCDEDAIQRSYVSMLALLRKFETTNSDHITSLFEYADWLWGRGKFQDSLDSLEVAEQIAKTSRLYADQAIAADKRGVYLQYSDQKKSALRCHKRATKIARQFGLKNLLETLLNNLGEAHRQLAHWDDANAVFVEAEELAGRHDPESAISTAHNRGLIAQNQGNFDAAETIFKSCKAKAERGGFTGEQVRAWEALANLSLVQGNEALSLKRYEKAIKIAKAGRISADVPRTALNYASLLRHIGRPKDSIRVLRPYAASDEVNQDSHLIHRTLGQAFHDAGKSSQAIASLEIAVELSREIEDIESLLISSSALSEALEDSERYTEASNVLLEVVNLEKDPELWVTLMDQLLRVQLAADDESSEETYDRATKFASRRNLYSALAELHMTVGFHYWIQEPESRTKALQAFAVASAHALTHDTNCKEVGEAFDDEESVAGEVLGRTLTLLTAPATATSQDELESLSQDLATWADSSIKNQEMIDFMTSPVRMAIKLLPLNRTPRKLAKMLEQLISDEFAT